MTEPTEILLVKSIQNHPDAPCLDWLKSGAKVYEGRLFTKIKEWNLFVGKRIKFFDQDNADSYIICEITSLLEFQDFATAFDTLGDKLVPGKTTQEKTTSEVIDMYNKFFHYAAENLVSGTTSKMILDAGTVAIGLKILYTQ